MSRYQRETIERAAQTKRGRHILRDQVGVQEPEFVIPHTREVWRDAKGHFRKAPLPGKTPRGWKKTKLVQYTNLEGKSVKKPEDPSLVSARWIQYREEPQPGKRSSWKNADKVDFRKNLQARIVEQRGDRKQPHIVTVLEDGKFRKWSKNHRAENRRFLVPEIFTGRKIEIAMEGRTVKEALGKYNWEVGEYGQRVSINSKVNYFYTDQRGIEQREKFNADIIEEWRSAPNIKSEGESKETYGSILRNRFAIEIRRGFASRRARFTSLDTLEELYEQGAFPDEEDFQQLYAIFSERDQAERVTMQLVILVEDLPKSTKKTIKKPN